MKIDFSDSTHPVLRTATWFTAIAITAVTLYLISRLFASSTSTNTVLDIISETLHSRMFWTAVAVGLAAQAVDGALGMAYGVTASTFLLSAGASPAVASASAHIAEIFTTGVSGIAHVRQGNVNRQLFLRLVVPGTIGALAGVVLVTQISGKALKPWIAAYLLVIGVYILSK